MALNFLGIDPVQALFYTAVINGLVAPPLLVLIVELGSDRTYLEDKVSGPLSKTLCWLAAGLMSIAAAALIATAFFIR
jgi:Mn2+/Fe2+ NRAMP family transporter